MNNLSRIAQALGLPDSGQDWGIEHSDPRRVLEFVAFAESLGAPTNVEMEALGELILQSAEEALEMGCLGDVERRHVVRFLKAYGGRFPMTLEYWSSLKEADGWFSAALLRESGHVP